MTDTIGPPAARSDTALVKDTLAGAKAAITVPSIPGRSKKDSLALVSAIRYGMKDTRFFWDASIDESRFLIRRERGPKNMIDGGRVAALLEADESVHG